MEERTRDGDDLVEFAEMLRGGGATDRAARAIDPAARRRRRRRGLIASAVVAVVVLAPPAGYAAWALNAPLRAPLAAITAPSAPAAPPAADIRFAPDGVAALSVAGAEAYLGPEAAGVWARYGDDEPRPIASITKLVTALVVLDAFPLADASDVGPTLTFDRADHALYDAYFVRDATIAAMPAGSSMSLRDALATMLVPSASNYAEVIAVWAFGSVDGYRRAADRWLSARGLERTTIVEPTGLDPRNTSTPTDLIALGRLAKADPTVSAIAATPSVSFPATGPLANTNRMLGEMGIDGLKTGTLEDSGSNLLYSATVDVGTAEPLRVIGVALGGASQQAVGASAAGVLQRLAAGFHRTALAQPGQRIGTYTTAWGSSLDVVLAEGASLLTWSDTPIVVEMQHREPVEWVDGETIGEVTWTAGPETDSTPVVLEGMIEPPTAWWRLTHPGEIG
ncbi:D-alanyl-D-alanine carboxypeptidase family protein [Microbacterium oleivorans]|uniref:D-alanyl-D-alanine carboxypeptidase n=1 Tax=Microbacterium oleivorans TaxID=273677 RepID=A0A7D5IRV3_9MICO|nr:serine hydrolase [Microbacterium oleivorans]QLD10997.1 D-alanyl-D-alanine carboxypeptidase [Microbacterium oleivorans]